MFHIEKNRDVFLWPHSTIGPCVTLLCKKAGRKSTFQETLLTFMCNKNLSHQVSEVNTAPVIALNPSI